MKGVDNSGQVAGLQAPQKYSQETQPSLGCSLVVAVEGFGLMDSTSTDEKPYG